jgi:hypothetical protein
MAPVMSSVTVASCVRSPSATVLQFVHQTQNGGLVGVVDALGFLLLAFGIRRCCIRPPWRKAAGPATVQTPEACRPQTAEQGTGQRQHQQLNATQAGLAGQALSAGRFQAGGRSGSLSATMAVCASRADTRPCRLPRMAPASVRVVFVQLDQLLPAARAPGHPWCRARRSSALPSSSPVAISRNEFKSLPSRNTASGLTPSIVRNSLADLPIRCVSITS